MISPIRLTFAGSTSQLQEKPPKKMHPADVPGLFWRNKELMLNSNDAAQSTGMPILQWYLEKFLKHKQAYLSKEQKGNRLPLPRTLDQFHEQMVHLLHRVAKINIPAQLDDGRMTLQEAFRSNHPFLVSGILKQRNGDEEAVELNRKDYLGATALQTAFLTRHYPEIKTMLKKGANPFVPDSAGKTPLQRLADMGETQRFEQLTQHIQPHLIDDQSQAIEALQQEAKQSELDISAYMADFATRSSNDRQATLVRLCNEKYSPESETQILRQALALLRLGASLNTFDRFGNSPLHAAASEGHDGLVFAFLQHGADPNIRDDKGNTPLLNAVTGCRVKVMNMLLQAGADANLANKQGNTPLIMGAYLGTSGMIKTLIDAGGNVNARNVRQETPLHLVAKSDSGCSSIAQALLQHGADPKAVDCDDSTPLSHAIAKYHIKLVKLFEPQQ